MNNEKELVLIPKYEQYIEYILLVIMKIPRTEKFSIGNEFKLSMYDTLEKILYISKIEKNKRMYYLNIVDTKLNCQRIYLRIMLKQRWIDEKKYKVAFEHLAEIGRIVGGLIKVYGKNIEKSI